MTTLTPKEVRNLWIADLEANGDKQGKGSLHNLQTNTYCCLGRLCVLAVAHGVIPEPVESESLMVYDFKRSKLPDKVRKWAGLSSVDGNFSSAYLDNSLYGGMNLWRLNDRWDYSFQEIANVIRSEPPGLCSVNESL